MNTIQNYAASALLAAVLLGLTGCDSMTRRDKNTAVGAAVGGVAGSVLTGGGTAVGNGGAVVGGVVGNQVGKA